MKIQSVKEQNDKDGVLVGYQVLLDNGEIRNAQANPDGTVKPIGEIVYPLNQWLKTNTPEPMLTDQDQLDSDKVDKKALFKQSYESAIQADIDYMNTTFQADLYSQDLITKSLSAGSLPSSFYWKDKFNTHITMSYADLQGLSQVILNRGMTNFAHLSDLKDAVDAIALSSTVTLADAQAQLDAIVW